MARTTSAITLASTSALSRLALAIGLLLPAATTLAQGADRTGAWWRADESGWGLFTVDQGSVLLPTWFTYDTEGRATWFIIAGAQPQADGSYSGDIYRFNGVPFAQIAGTANDPGVKVGSARLSFSDADTVDFQYSVDGVSQSKTLDRFDWGDQAIECSASSADPASFDNYTALWWNPQQSGWGLQINHVGDLVSATWYTYGEDRKPAWFLFNATRQSDGRYTGTLLRGRSGLRFDQINGQRALGQIDEVGTVSLRFLDGARAEFTHVQGGISRSIEIRRAQYGNRVTQCRTVADTPPPPPPGGGSGDECYPPLRVGDRFVTEDDAGGRIEQVITGTSTYKGRPVFVLEDRVQANGNATVREFVEQTATHRIYLGGEGYIPEAQAQGTYEYDPPVQIPRGTPVGSRLDLNYVVRNRYTAMGQAVSLDVRVRQQTERTGSADVNVPAGSFAGACAFDTRLDFDSTVSVAGFSVRTQSAARTLQWAHPEVGVVRSETDTETTVSTTGTPVPVPPTITAAQDESRLVEAVVNGRRYP